jgi:tetratricopeptide (TPR) repeat protein
MRQYRSCWSYSLSFHGEDLLARGRRRKAERLLHEADSVARSGPIDFAINSDLAASSSWAFSLLGVLHATAGVFDVAEAESSTAMRLWTEPGRPTWGAVRAAIAHATVLRRRSAVLYHQGQTHEALAVVDRCIESLEATAQQFPTVDWARNELCDAYLVRGDCSWHLSDIDDTERAYRQAVACSDDLPETSVIAKSRLAQLLWHTGRRQESHSLYASVLGEANGHVSRAVETQLGQLLLSAVDLSVRNAPEGMEAALRTLAPEDGLSVRQLGLAHYRTGDYEQAHHLLVAAAERLNGGDAQDFCLIAMTQHRLGHYDSAMEWLDRGRASHDRCLTLFHEVQAVQHEAESLVMSREALRANNK